MARKTRRERLLQEIIDQKRWIARRGGTLAAYIQHYGDPGVPPLDENGEPKTVSGVVEGLVPVPNSPGVYFMPHYGNGGSAIWKADSDHLRQLESELEFHRV